MILICWLIEIYYTLRYSVPISGHDYIEQSDGSLKCSRCDIISE